MSRGAHTLYTRDALVNNAGGHVWTILHNTAHTIVDTIHTIPYNTYIVHALVNNAGGHVCSPS